MPHPTYNYIRPTDQIPVRQDGPTDTHIALVKLFDPCGRFTLFVTQFDGEDTVFGFVRSPLGDDCDEWGYSSLAELTSVRNRFGLPLERDLHFTPTTVAALRAQGEIRDYTTS